MESKLFHSASILHVIIEVFFSFFIHPHRKDLEDFVQLRVRGTNDSRARFDEVVVLQYPCFDLCRTDLFLEGRGLMVSRACL